MEPAARFYLQFRPTVAGPITGTLLAGGATVNLSGTATSGGVVISPVALTFAAPVNTASSSQKVTVTNNTGAAAAIAPIASANFAVSLNGCPATLINAASCSIYVQFRPTVAGTLTGTLLAGGATVNLTGN